MPSLKLADSARCSILCALWGASSRGVGRCSDRRPLSFGVGPRCCGRGRSIDQLRRVDLGNDRSSRSIPRTHRPLGAMVVRRSGGDWSNRGDQRLGNGHGSAVPRRSAGRGEDRDRGGCRLARGDRRIHSLTQRLGPSSLRRRRAATMMQPVFTPLVAVWGRP